MRLREGGKLASTPKELARPLGQVINKTGVVDFTDARKSAVTRYREKLHHLSVIWERLETEVAANDDYFEWLESIAWHLEKGSQEEASTRASLRNYLTRGLSLDFEDFLIHSSILMDRVAAIIGYLLPGTISDMDDAKFRELRDFFRNPKNIPYGPDEEFAKYMRERTGRSDTMLRDYRNKLVVHDLTSQHAGMVFGPSTPTRLARLKFGPPDAARADAEAKLAALKAKYASKFEALSKLQPDFFLPIVDFFDARADEIDSEDKAELRRIKEKLGGYLPDVNLLADRIIVFLTYCGEHFQKREVERSE